MVKRTANKSGFTLVELLVVTIIIGILLAITSVAVLRALDYAKRVRIYTEETEIAKSFHALMLEFQLDTYPPADLRMDDADDLLRPIARYMRRAFPRYNVASLYSDLQEEEVNTAEFDPAHALVFWLVGFNTNPEDPLDGHKERMLGQDLNPRLFKFDPVRLVGKRYLYVGKTAFDGASFTDPATQRFRAYLYFDNNGGSYGVPFLTFNPYCTGGTGNYYYNSDSCQIVSAGNDQYLGAGGASPAVGVPYAGKDADNVANFGDGKTMAQFIEGQSP